MPPKTSLNDFEAMVRRSGLALTAAEIAELHGAWGYVEEMLERLRTPELPPEAELALTFRADSP